MIAENHPSRKFAPLLIDLAEGRIARDTWLAWWQDHAPELERTLLPGWLLILKPRLNRTANETMAGAVAAASHILTAMEIEHATEDRYRVAAQAEHEARLAEIERKDLERAATFRTGIDAIKEVYPRFGRLLQRRIDLITQLDPSATESELMAEEQSLGVQLPGALKRLLLASRQVNLANFQIGLANVFFHEPYAGTKGPSDGMICIADYFLEADGDQVLLDPRDLPADDPPVNYYAHSVPEVRLLARSFSGWLESLTRSPLFRE